MAQRYDIVRIDFQANAGKANAAIESLRKTADDCNTKYKELQKTLKEGIKNGMSAKEAEGIRVQMQEQLKLQKVYQKGYQELVKGMRVLDQGVKAFNDGTLRQMSAAFQKALYNAAKLTRTKLAPDAESYKKDYKELTALMDASQQNYVRLQGDAQQLLKTLRDGGKVSVAALNEELKAQRELLSVMSENDKGYKQTQRNVAELDLYLKKMGGDYEFIRQNITDTKKISDDMLRNMYRELEQVNREGKVTKDIMRDNAAAMKEIRTEQARRVESVLGGDLGKQSEQSIRAQITNAKELLATYKTNSKEAQQLSAQIVNAEEHLRTHGVEAARAAQREAQQIKTQEEAERQLQATMNKRLQSLKTLSADALVESRKYWEAQRNGAEVGTAAFKKAEAALKSIENQERSRKVAQLDTILGDPKKFGVGEVRNAVREMEMLRDSVQQGIPAWQHYNKMLEQGRAYLDNLAKTEAAAKIEAQMQNLTTLSAQGLAETKKYWETMVAGAANGSTELATYENRLKEVTAEEQRRMELQAQGKVSILGGDLGQYSEVEIRKAIEAGQQLIQTYKTADPEAKKLAQNIVAAEQHLKQYGVEAERAAQREVEALRKAAEQRKQNDALMKKQLQEQGAFLSESALKAQQQYWQRLIDDPKTAAASLQEYKQRLQEVQSAQQTQVQIAGEKALRFFRGDTSNASANQIKENADALKKYRDSLPQQTNADIIAEINSYILKTGESAKVAAGEVMKVADAEVLAGKLGTQGFSASTNELKLAKKALEEEQQTVGRASARFTELQDKINKVDLELAKTGEIAKNVQEVLDQPKGKSLNALKQAVEQGRAALQNMDRTTVEGQKAFDELAKKVKATELELKTLSGTSKATASSFDKAWSRLKTYIGLYVGAAVAMQKLTQTMGDLMDLSDKMGEVRKTTGFSADEVGRLTENLKKMDTRTSINGLLDLSVAAGQLGLKTQEDVMGFTEAANKLMVALPEMGREGATEMLKVALATGEIDKIRKQMDQGLIEGSSATAVAMEKVGSTIDRLRATSAATAPAITDFVKRVGAVGAQSGISIDQVAALGSTVDALGMRVEMSATALSRMIPAIKNNAFDIAQILKVEPNTIRALYDTGHAMDVILMILEKMQGQDADTIEAMLGKGGMQELMKELNQQGARAGIVFGGLSQNVEELRRQLGVAKKAYEENTAVTMEYNKMNETTAAKWERLKNRVSEFFVGDSAQKWLGTIIDGLNTIADIVDTIFNSWLKWIVVFAGAFRIGIGEALFTKIPNALVSIATKSGSVFKFIGAGLSHLAVSLGIINKDLALMNTRWKEIDASTKKNFLGALLALLAILVVKWYEYATATSKAFFAQLELDREIENAVREVNTYFDAIYKTNAALQESQATHDRLSAEVDRLRRSTGDASAATEDLKNKEALLHVAEQKLIKDKLEHSNAIKDMNAMYSKYLGFIVTETTDTHLLAAAHERVAAAIREEMLAKQKQAALDKIREEHEQDNADKLAGLYERLNRKGIGATQAQKIARDFQDFLDNGMRYDATAQEYRINPNYVNGPGTSGGDMRIVIAAWLDNYLQKNTHLNFGERNYITGLSPNTMQPQDLLLGPFAWAFAAADHLFGNNARHGIGDSWTDYIRDKANMEQSYDLRMQGLQGENIAARNKLIGKLRQNVESVSDTNANYANIAQSIVGLEHQMLELDERNIDDAQQIVNISSLIRAAKNIGGAKLEAEIKKARQAVAAASGGNIPTNNGSTTPTGGGSSLYGEDIDPESTEYSTWNVDQLVARYRQMDRFKNVLRDGVDIEKVLAEDAALQAAIRRGEVDPTNWHSAQAWYESERKKIQRELRSEHNSGTSGHWIDEKTKKGRKRRNLFHESDWALAELDRYYSRRKETLEKARAEENISEELFNRQAELLEQEHLQKRSDLRRVFTETLTKEETKAFKAWWASLSDEKVRELEAVDWETIQKEWRRANNAQLGANNLKAQKDLTEMQSITVKHLNKVAKIVAKERPYDGIVDNLRSTLTEMGILFADMESEAVGDIEAMARVQARRLSFLIENAEQAYSMTVEDLLTKMREAGLTGWAQSIEQDDTMKYSLLAALHKAYDAVQDAIKKESSQIKKQVENIWNDAVDTLPNNMSRKDAFENAMAMLGLEEERVSGANSLIGAGYASENVAEKLAIKQMQISLAQQEHYFNLMRAQGLQRIDTLRREAEYERSIEKSLSEQAQKAREAGDEERARVLMQDAEVHAQQALSAEFDAQHAATALNLATAEEQKKLDEQRVAIAKKLDESYGRLYKHLREWGELLSSSLLSVMEAGSAGNAEYYNERAKMRLTGKGGPGAGTYIVIDNEGTSGATAHYEYLDEEEALRRQHEIEQENARAEAWKKVMDDVNMKMSEMITDKLNAMLQNTAVDANTQQVIKNTEELARLNANVEKIIADRTANMTPAPEKKIPHTTVSVPEPPVADNGQQLESNGERVDAYGNPIEPGSWLDKALGSNPDITEAYINAADRVDAEIEADNHLTEAVVDNAIKRKQAQIESHKASTAFSINSDNKEQASTEAKFAAMAQAANLYGIAYQTMSNANLSTAQKFEMFALQAAGQALISMLTMDLAQGKAKENVQLPGILGKLLGEMPLPAAMAAFAGITALMGGLMAMAVSSVSRSKSQISQVSGASASAGRLATGMLTYAEGNVNEFTDPGSLTQGRQYSVDGADGKTYRARYMGSNPKTHLTNGPEFHLVGEAGREAIIDARTTRLIRMNEPEIWRSIQTLYNGGSLRHAARRGRGVRTFADGNLGEMDNGEWMMDNGMSFDPVAMQASLDRNSAVQEALLERLNRPIYARNILYGPEGLPNVIAKLQKEAQRHGERYL